MSNTYYEKNAFLFQIRFAFLGSSKVDVDVADTSIEYDRDIKLPLYAQAGIPEYWIVDIQNHQIEVYHMPSGKNYRHRELVQAGEEVTFNALGVSIPLEKLIGPPVTS